MKNIVFVGYMGSGKTSVGQCLSNLIKKDFIDLDAYIEEHENLSIQEIFERKGSVYFRKLEYQLLQHILKDSENLILSLGGGTPVYFNNMDMLIGNTNLITVFLNASIDRLCNNLFEERSSRPLISHLKTKADLKEYIAKHLFERRSEYLKAHYTISTDGKTADEISRELITLLF